MLPKTKCKRFLIFLHDNREIVHNWNNPRKAVDKTIYLLTSIVSIWSLPNYITTRIVVADHEIPTFVALNFSAAKARRIFPHHLSTQKRCVHGLQDKFLSRTQKGCRHVSNVTSRDKISPIIFTFTIIFCRHVSNFTSHDKISPIIFTFTIIFCRHVSNLHHVTRSSP